MGVSNKSCRAELNDLLEIFLFLCYGRNLVLFLPHIKAGIHVQGHLDVGQGIVQLFNDLVEQLGINPENGKTNLDHPLESEAEVRDVLREDAEDVHIVESSDNEVSQIEQLRNSREESIHLYGHHSYDKVKTKPLNNIYV